MKLQATTVLTLTALLASGGGQLAAQTPQTLTVPISDPSRPVQLDASLVSGSISVTGYDGDQVLIEAVNQSQPEEPERVDGMLRIPNNSIGMTVEENDNRVEVSADWSSQDLEIKIQLPRRSSVRLSTVNNGDLSVRNIAGEVELNNTNGAIEAVDIDGSVVASTTNGAVKVTFIGITPDKAMSFSTWNGEVDVTFPASLTASLRMNSGQGDVYSDFDVALEASPTTVEREEGRRGYKVRIEKEVRGTIGGGGPEMRFKTYNGDIYLRKQK